MGDQSSYTKDDSLKLPKAYKFAGRFQLLNHMGQGGFGQVWRVRDVWLDQEVALKISMEDLTTETLVLRRLPKDRYVSIFDYVTDSGFGASAYSMELLERPWMTLDDYQKQDLEPRFKNRAKAINAVKMVIYIGIDLLTTLGELHGKKHGRNQWCHADVKPQNLYLSRKRAKLAGEAKWREPIAPILKVGDLGLACRAGSPRIAGTPDYMGPEGRVLPASDLFAVGQTIASMILGMPFDQEELKSVARMKMTLAQQIPSAHIVERVTKALRKMTYATPSLRGNSDDSIRLLRSVLASEEDWAILTLFMTQTSADGITLSESTDILFDELALSRGWRNRTNERVAELKSMIKSMYERGILSRNGHKYKVRA